MINRLLGQILEEGCVQYKGQSFDPILMKLFQKVYLNKI